MRNWKSDDVDVQYLLDSGLLFRINQTVLHLVGIGMKVEVDSAGKKSIGFVDCRKEPESLTFSDSAFVAGEEKCLRYRKEFGGEQIIRRQAKLGVGCQSYPIVRRK